VSSAFLTASRQQVFHLLLRLSGVCPRINSSAEGCKIGRLGDNIESAGLSISVFAPPPRDQCARPRKTVEVQSHSVALYCVVPSLHNHPPKSFRSCICGFRRQQDEGQDAEGEEVDSLRAYRLSKGSDVKSNELGNEKLRSFLKCGSFVIWTPERFVPAKVR
jgi:hypothetical protein